VDDHEPGEHVPRIDFGRLTEVSVADVRDLLNEPRNHRHMPLAGDFSLADTVRWVRDKDAQWDQHGYGPEAVHVDGAFAGWGGFQREDAGADLSLVIAPRYRGLGAAVARRFLDRGFTDLGLDEVVVALPFSRREQAITSGHGSGPTRSTDA
jgi:[ribosomal protein S5]-alanine N-acetyltransferase